MTEKREIDECSKEIENLDLNSYETEDEECAETAAETEMWESYRQSVLESREREEVDDDTCYNPISVLFSEDHLSQEEDLCEVWETKVQPLFKRHRLSCRLNWDERKMTVGTKRGVVEDYSILNMGACSLALLSRGFGTECLEQIFSCEVHCEYVELDIPNGMSQDDFSSKYQKFMEKIEEFRLPEKLSCLIIYGEGGIFAYSDKPWAVYKMKDLVYWCLLGDNPFDQEHFRELGLDDLED